MHLDPVLPLFVGVVLIFLVLGAAAIVARQPSVVGYLVAGMVLGPQALGLVYDVDFITRLGAVGVVLLLFFIGLEIAPRALAANWRIAVVGTLLQIMLTTALVCGLGALLDWSLNRSILLGFVVSLSSTAVVLKLLQDWGELDTTVGRDVLGILLAQDVMVIPMLVVLGFLAGEPLGGRELVEQLIGAVILIGLVVLVARQGEFELPFASWLRRDPDLQVLAALVICFGLAVFSGGFHLSTALGAFVAGMVVRAARQTAWAEDGLEGFRVLFVALFFASIGMLIDWRFIAVHWWQMLALVTMVVVLNTLLGSLLIRALGRSWRDSLYAGALLSQVGEFSFVLAAIGLQAGVITGYAYQATVALIAISLVVSAGWIRLAKHLLDVAIPEPSHGGPSTKPRTG